MLAMLNGWEIVLIFAVILVLFGAKRLPELARGLGQGVREFKKASQELTDQIENADQLPPHTPAQISNQPQASSTSSPEKK